MSELNAFRYDEKGMYLVQLTPDEIMELDPLRDTVYGSMHEIQSPETIRLLQLDVRMRRTISFDSFIKAIMNFMIFGDMDADGFQNFVVALNTVYSEQYIYSGIDSSEDFKLLLEFCRKQEIISDDVYRRCWPDD